MNTATKRYAFISYNHKDKDMAKWLQAKLESYKLPTEIHNEFEDSRYLRPVFRDKTDLNTGILSDELRKNLQTSKYLVVLCSPNSAHSKWVNDEVKAFIDMGRTDRIIPFIIDGTPHSTEDECLPPALMEMQGENELLGISIKEVGKQKAFIKLVSKMLGVDFDVLWQRHKRQQRNKRIAAAICIPIVSSLLYYVAMPVSFQLDIDDAAHQLPMPESSIVSIDGVDYEISKIDTCIIVDNMPGYYRGKTLDVTFKSTYYEESKHTYRLGLGMNNSANLTVERDSTFAIYGGTVYDEDGNSVAGATVDIDGITTQTDANGRFRIELELKRQSETKVIKISRQGMTSIVRDDECPDSDLKYIMRR